MGNYKDPNNPHFVYDLWFSADRVIIARFGENGDYHSAPSEVIPFIMDNFRKHEGERSVTAIIEAIRRADMFGLVSKDN